MNSILQALPAIWIAEALIFTAFAVNKDSKQGEFNKQTPGLGPRGTFGFVVIGIFTWIAAIAILVEKYSQGGL